MCVWLPRALFPKRIKWVSTFLLPSQRKGTMCITQPAPAAASTGGTVWEPAQSWAKKAARSVEPVCHLQPESTIGEAGTNVYFGVSQGFASTLNSVSASASSSSDSLQLSLLLAKPFHPVSLALTWICIISPGIWGQITFPRSVVSSSCPCSVSASIRGIRCWQRALVV